MSGDENISVLFKIEMVISSLADEHGDLFALGPKSILGDFDSINPLFQVFDEGSSACPPSSNKNNSAAGGATDIQATTRGSGPALSALRHSEWVKPVSKIS